MFRRARLIMVATVLAAGGLATVPLSGAAEEPTKPDLGMARLSDFKTTITTGGVKQLRFSATIVNVGAGPFQLKMSRSSTGSAFDVAQLLSQPGGSPSEVPVATDLVFGGDGHGHWHIKDLEHYELQRLDNGVKVGTSAKSGFCFFDTTAYRLSLPGAPQSQVYRSAGCGQQSSLSLTMGVSVGWGDTYPWSLPDQYIDITGLANGKYRLVATADPDGRFIESNPGNNTTWVDLALTTRKNGTSVKVLGYGPSA